MNSIVIDAIRQQVQSFVQPNLCMDSSHDIDHFEAVLNHAQKAIESDKTIPEDQHLNILAAAYLHDVDDKKLAKGEYKGKNYWLKLVLERVNVEYINIDAVVTMVNLVSCSENGDSYDKNLPLYYYIPRYCDRLEAIGKVGIERCLEYNKNIGKPVHTPDTVRVTTLWQLKQVAIPERYKDYTSGVKGKYPVSVIDHVYEKLLHIKLPSWMKNLYLEDQFMKRVSFIEEWVLDYWKENK